MKYRALDKNGDFVFGAGQGEFLVNTAETVAQAVMTRLWLWQGEWFLDTSKGMPWMTQVVGKMPRNTRDTAIRTEVINTIGVKSILAYDSRYDPHARMLIVRMTIDTLYGAATITLPAASPVTGTPTRFDFTNPDWSGFNSLMGAW
jgi:hypothetical protein